MSLKTLTSVLELQATLMASPKPLFSVGIQFVRDLNDALDILHRTEAQGAMIVNHNTGFGSGFVTKACASGEDIVFGVSPLPGYDWERVAKRSGVESAESSAHVFNVMLSGGPRADGYATVAGLRDVPAMYVRKSALTKMVKAHAGIVGDGKSVFVADSVHDGVTTPGIAQFVARHGKPVVADIEHPMSVCAPMVFCGRVDGRKYLR